jgi:hypothetical protein
MSIHEFLNFLNKIKQKNPSLEEEKFYISLADKIEQETPVVLSIKIHHRESLAIKEAQEKLQKSLAQASPALPAADAVKTEYEVLKDELFPLYNQHNNLFQDFNRTRNMKILIEIKALEKRIKKLELEISKLGLKQ